MARRKAHPLIKEIESAMMLGQFIPYGDMFEFVQDLESVEKKLVVVAGRNGNHVAVELYETFLAACYEKVEETDDSGGYFGMFFQDLFVGWIKARHAATFPEADTVSQIVKWKQNDCYGLCHEIEKEIGRVLSPVSFDLFAKHFKEQIQAALDSSNISPPLPVFKYPNDIRLPFITLKNLYESKGSARKYADVCAWLGFAPRDCERLANLESKRSRWQQALSWIDKGIELEPTINWHNESSYALDGLRIKVLKKLGRKNEALTQTWDDFEKNPGVHAYEELMQSVPRGKKSEWHQKAMLSASAGRLDDYVDLCVQTREWDLLAKRVHVTDHSKLESITHYSSEPAAKKLMTKAPLAAAKLYRALGIRIVNQGKSKYYGNALQHLKFAHKLYLKAGKESEWKEIVAYLQLNHSRKRGFMHDLEQFSQNE